MRALVTHAHTQTHTYAQQMPLHTHTHTQLETSDCVTYENVIGTVGVEEEEGGTEHWSRTVVKKNQ